MALGALYEKILRWHKPAETGNDRYPAVSEDDPLPVQIISGGGGGGSGDASEATLQDILAENQAILAQLMLQAALADTQPVVDGAAGTILSELLAVEGDVDGAAVDGDTNGGTNNARLRALNKLFTNVKNGTWSLRVTQDESNKVNDEVAAARPECTRYQATRSASGEAEVIAAPAAGFHLEIWRIQAQAWEDGAQTVSWRPGTGGTDNFSWKLLLDGDGYSPALNGSWHLATETALYVNTSSANDVRLLVEYRVVADADRA